jgi:phosphopantothenoylcysteine decarboxylase/phosphopantothenate--cysteine ligase
MKGKILLGVTGGIAAFKAAELTSRLTQKGIDVTVVMTEAAAHFVAPLTFRTLSGNEVFKELFPENISPRPIHISLRDRADLLAIVPATANIIGKIANGIADDLLSTLALSFEGPVIVAPAMNEAMYRNYAVQENLKKLKSMKITVIPPQKGYLACGYIGEGRLADIEKIEKAILEKIPER